MNLALIVLAEAACMFVFLDRMLARHARQVANLCQRLQAPETAVAQHVVGQTTPVAHLPFDDDGAFLKYATDTFTIGDNHLA